MSNEFLFYVFFFFFEKHILYFVRNALQQTRKRGKEGIKKERKKERKK